MNIVLPSDAKVLHSIIAGNEEWLIDRILFYAKKQGYAQHSSTLREAWRQSIAGLSRPLLDTLEEGVFEVELKSGEDYTDDPLTQFGILEAQRHRERGIALNMFLGLMKYYRQSYLDLLDRELSDRAIQHRITYLLERVFDRMEIGLVTAWHKPEKNARMEELQRANRTITNEKNKYLTIFESIQSPVAVLTPEYRIDAVNHAWVKIFSGISTPGANYYDNTRIGDSVSWLSEEIGLLTKSQADERTVEKTVETTLGQRQMSVKIKRMLDVSDKFSWWVILLDDVTHEKKAEASNRKNQRLQGVLELAGAVCHDMNQPLMAISGYAELVLMQCPADAPYRGNLQKIIEQVSKVGSTTRKLMNVTRYKTKPYLDKQIIDIEKASDST